MMSRACIRNVDDVLLSAATRSGPRNAKRARNGWVASRSSRRSISSGTAASADECTQRRVDVGEGEGEAGVLEPRRHHPLADQRTLFGKAAESDLQRR